MFYLFSILFVAIFLGLLFSLDCFSLIRDSILLFSLACGILCFGVHFIIQHQLGMLDNKESIYIIALVELIKILFIAYLIWSEKAVFVIDTFIYAATVGIGYAFLRSIEYSYYHSHAITEDAILFGITTTLINALSISIAGMYIVTIFNAIKRKRIIPFIGHLIIALVIAVALRFGFSQITSLSPFLVLIITLAATFILIYILVRINNKTIANSLYINMNEQVKLLLSMKRGDFSKTPAGYYLLSMKKQFSSECFFDIICYMQTYLELAMEAKRKMMMEEAGMNFTTSKNIKSMLLELKSLKKQIGKAGMMALRPVIKAQKIENWMTSTLNK